MWTLVDLYEKFIDLISGVPSSSNPWPMRWRRDLRSIWSGIAKVRKVVCWFEPFGIAIAIAAFVISIPPVLIDLKDRDANRIFQAWQVLGSTTQGLGSSFAKRDAVEFLNEEREGAMCSVLIGWISDWMIGDQFRKCVLPPKPQSNLTGVNLEGVNLEDLQAENALLIDAKLMDADLIDADLIDADLSDADLSDADLSDADLIGADLIDTDLSDAILLRADLSGATLLRTDLSGADLSDADLIGAELIDVDLRDANVSSADFTNTTRVRVDLTGAWYRSDDPPIGIDHTMLRVCSPAATRPC